ncbi:MAG: ABC transporter ATP-binding protein [Candidatus Ozemobacteraceae bacterium]
MTISSVSAGNPDQTSVQSSVSAVRVRGLRKVFPEVTAVENLDLDIQEGEIFGIVGPDGAGKTTTIRMLCGLLDVSPCIPDEAPRSGEKCHDGTCFPGNYPRGGATVAGCDVIHDPESVKRRIGYMPQKFSLYGDLTVAENIIFFANLFHVPTADRKRREEELLKAARMTPFRDRLAMNLSGGMKQKLALTCTLIHRPRVLFLDEPTTGVDPVSRRDFWRILTTLLGEGVTLIICTPSMDEAERCHRVAFMNRGRIIVCDTPEGLKKRLAGDLYEVTVEPQRPAAKILGNLSGVKNVQIFGDRLHMLVNKDVGKDQLVQMVTSDLAKAHIPIKDIRPIPPGLEDVFIALAAENHT